MIPTSTALFLTISLIMKKSAGLWIYPSQASMLSLLHQIYTISIADRTLRYHRLNFRNKGKIYCRRRWKRRENGTVFIQTTAMALTISGYQDLVRMGHSWAAKYIKRLIQKYGSRSDSAKHPAGKIPSKASDESPQEPTLDPSLFPT